MEELFKAFKGEPEERVAIIDRIVPSSGDEEQEIVESEDEENGDGPTDNSGDEISNFLEELGFGDFTRITLA